MKKQYDFSEAVRGKFYRSNAVLRIPVYLDREVQNFRGGNRGIEELDVATVVNELLKSDMRLAEVMGAMHRDAGLLPVSERWPIADCSPVVAI